MHNTFSMLNPLCLGCTYNFATDVNIATMTNSIFIALLLQKLKNNIFSKKNSFNYIAFQCTTA